MVISHKNKYLFIETPQTGCSAIRNELIEYYDGEAILAKHSVYSHFLAIASEEEKKYFVFSSVRNPLDKAVSHFLKFKTNHNNRFTGKLSKNWKQAIFQYRNKFKFRKFNKKGFSYSDYLKSISPFDDMSTLDHKKFNFIIRYETLNEDFKETLELLNLDQVRELPKYNATATKIDYIEYYQEKKTQRLAFKKFAVFMNYWEYEFPFDCSNYKLDLLQLYRWHFFHCIRIITWRYVRKNEKD